MSDLHNHLEMAAGEPDRRLDLEDLHARAATRHQRRRRYQAIGVVGATAIVVLALVVSLAIRRPTTPVKVAGQPPATASSSTLNDIPAGAQPGWHQMASAPISGRRDAVTAWTGSELVVVGGTKALPEPTCPMGSQLPRCDPSTPSTPGQWLRDGAAYDPATYSWHAIAPLPDGFVTSQTAGIAQSPVAVLDGKVYVLGWVESTPTTPLLASYDPTTDQWSELPIGASAPTWWSLATFADKLVVYDPLGLATAPSAYRDRVFDPRTGSWSDLPTDPIALRFTPGRIRQLFGLDDKLYDFSSAGAVPGKHGDDSVVVAEYDGHRWQEFSVPTSNVPYGIWTATGDHLTMIVLGHLYAACPDGSPDGSPALTFDPSSNTFGTPPKFPGAAARDLDFCPAARGQGAVAGNGHSVAVASPVGALILDPAGVSWTTASGPGDPKLEGFSLAWAGGQLVRWGGGIAEGSDRTLHLNLSDQGWIWTPPNPESGTTPTTTPPAPTTTVPAPATTSGGTTPLTSSQP